jgi:hypothetical protein
MKNFLYILLLIVVFSCNQKSKENDEYFEGIVEFEVKNTPYQFGSVDKMESIYGVKLINYINKDGFNSREYINRNNIILRRNIFRPDSLKLYTYGARHDTATYIFSNKAYWMDVVSIQEVQPKKILDYWVKGIQCKVCMCNPLLPRKIYVTSTYYNLPMYKLNPLNFKNTLFCGVDKIFEKAPYITVGMDHEVEGYGKTEATATVIKKQKVEPHNFFVPSNYIQIESEF